MIAEIEKSWAAGFFEGEGSVRIAAQPSNRSLGVLTVEISQVDKEPLTWISERWPGTLHFIQPRAQRGRPFYRWVRISYDAVAFLVDIRPFVVRQQVADKISLGLAFQAQKIRTHENRTEAYRATQAEFINKMRDMNRRGIQVERAALATRMNG